MEAVLGSDSTREIVRLFLNDFPKSIRRLEQGSRDDQMRIVHGIKSSSLHIGASGLSEMMAGLERRLMNGDGDLLPEEITGAVAKFESEAPALRKYGGA
jgi:hypothetical protein